MCKECSFIRNNVVGGECNPDVMTFLKMEYINVNVCNV